MKESLPPQWQEFYDQLPEYIGGTFEFVGGETPWNWVEIGGEMVKVEMDRVQRILPPFQIFPASMIIPGAPDELGIVFNAVGRDWRMTTHVTIPSAYTIHKEENGVLLEATIEWETKFRFKKKA